MTEPRRIILSGCSGGGKSTLIAALATRGHLTVPEPGRRIVQRELADGGTALPWSDGPAFAAACIDLALSDLATLPADAPLVFFDRSLHDNAFALRRMGLPAPANARIRPYTQVILLPPWPDLRQTDAERRGPMDEALTEYDDLLAHYPDLYQTTVMPRAPVPDRLDWLTNLLGMPL